VLVGEVWLASGQSNMEMPLAGWGKVMDYEKEIAAANFPNIRLFTVPRTIAYQPQSDVKTKGWQLCSPQTIPEFSSTAYFFGRKLHQDLNVPVGIIHSSWGGTVVEAWTSAGALKTALDFSEQISRMESQSASAMAEARRTYDEARRVWFDSIHAADRGYAASPNWFVENLDAAEWKTMRLPELWENAGLTAHDGVVWFRKDITLPETWAGEDLTLYAGKIDDVDSTYFNGEKIGSHNIWNEVRKYTVPGRLVRAGKNTIAIRVFDWVGGGGIWDDPADLKLVMAGSDSLSLVGDWMYRIGMDLKEVGPQPRNPDDPNYPTVLFNGMINPLIPYALKGAIWYQGESNAGRAYQYRMLFPLMIDDWRNRWQQGAFPFLFVQLASWQDALPEPNESDWAELREAQTMTLLTRPNTGMAVAIDIGDAKDIHPKNKQEVGRRLALNALKIAYEKNVACSGPIYKSMKVEGNRIRIKFSHTDGGLAAKDSPTLKGFAMAGADHVFRWAEAKIDGNEILVWHKEIKNPVAVRYAWAANPVCNLYNGAGLPASPFRTDDWTGVTAGRK
jgi:sialate O-acetylesterase